VVVVERVVLDEVDVEVELPVVVVSLDVSDSLSPCSFSFSP
jgi:hypothetical protein